MKLVILYVRTAFLASLIAAACGCHSGQKTATAKTPPPPALKPVPQPSSTVAAKPAETATPAQKSEPKEDEARQNFDSALNELLGSNVDVRSDERLGKEFERIVQGVNDLYPGGTAEADASQE